MSAPAVTSSIASARIARTSSTGAWPTVASCSSSIPQRSERSSTARAAGSSSATAATTDGFAVAEPDAPSRSKRRLIAGVGNSSYSGSCAFNERAARKLSAAGRKLSARPAGGLLGGGSRVGYDRARRLAVAVPVRRDAGVDDRGQPHEPVAGLAPQERRGRVPEGRLDDPALDAGQVRAVAAVQEVRDLRIRREAVRVVAVLEQDLQGLMTIE